MRTQYKDGDFVLSIQQIKQIFNSCDNWRDKLLLQSMYYCALRRFEVCNLDVRDIDQENGFIRVYGKGDKLSIIPVGDKYPDYFADLKLYIQNRRSGYIFLTNRKKKLSLARINQILKEVSNKAGVKQMNPNKKNINPHMLRHSQARHLKDNNHSIEFIQNYLRHSSFKTTFDSYGKMSINDMKKEMKNLRER